MNSDDDSICSLKLNPKVCTLLQRPEPKQAATLPSRPSLKRLVGNAVVQRLRHENHKLAIEEFVREPEDVPKVSQEAALNYFARRNYNSLQSRDMMEKEAKEKVRLRSGPFTQLLAKDISRRHFCTAQQYDTGSKFPDAAGKLNQRGPEARDPLLTLMQSRKLLAMADVLLMHPGSIRVGPQPSDAEAMTDRIASSHNSALDKNERPSCGSCSVPELSVVPSLDATRYALAMFSPHSGHRAPTDMSAAVRPATHGLRTKQRTGSHYIADPVFEVDLTAADAGKGSAARQPDAVDGCDSITGIDAPRGRLQLEDVGRGDGEALEATIPDVNTESTSGSEAQRNSSLTAALPVPVPSSTAPAEVGMLGVYREEMPAAVPQMLLADKLKELLAASRGLFAQVENVLGPHASSRAAVPVVQDTGSRGFTHA
ncbi:hypothetical protein Vretimale_12342 [Volvox reticuliferus]|uniref:Uncharacterized protein n=1 Tax=Volvox reticuliferus TaxID=1737510 RepID=A0A8J4FL93_9CHLO|nr:hypothetical protein Vretifemale_9052 [Volvox reticuliferus]GIM08355.1 hypothetical protein Vretimale_12342 [Volvox reticuliferus]